MNLVSKLLKAEFNLWKTKWIRENDGSFNIPNNALDYLIKCNENIYLAINHLFKINATLPVSVSNAEKSFFTLRHDDLKHV